MFDGGQNIGLSAREKRGTGQMAQRDKRLESTKKRRSALRMSVCGICASVTLMSAAVGVYADVIDGFDGFKWGALREEVLQRRGQSPLWDLSFSLLYTAKGETSGGFAIETVEYTFHGPCDASPTCLTGGNYGLAANSKADCEALTAKLTQKYGKYRALKRTGVVDGKTVPLFKPETINRAWQQSDKSSIEILCPANTENITLYYNSRRENLTDEERAAENDKPL